MGFSLKQLDVNEFGGRAGTDFTIALEADRGALAGVLARYDGEERSGPRFSYRLAARKRNLVASFVASDPRAVVTLFEIDGDTRRPLARRIAHDNTIALRIVPD